MNSFLKKVLARLLSTLLNKSSNLILYKEYYFRYWGRRIPRSEFARRVSAIDSGHLNRVATRHFWDKVYYNH
jgi:processing peptidase subunit beta